eukprot:g26829.t1
MIARSKKDTEELFADLLDNLTDTFGRTELKNAPADPAQVPADPAQVPADPAQVPADPAQVPADPAQVPADPAQVQLPAVSILMKISDISFTRTKDTYKLKEILSPRAKKFAHFAR